MTYQINYAYTSHIGKVRANNEDNFWCCGDTLPTLNQGTEGILKGKVSLKAVPALAVFDGMGGESCGEMAAGLAAEEFGRYYEANKRVLKKKSEAFFDGICASMNREVCRYGEENRIHSLGTTAAMVLFGPDSAYVGNLGDSRVYYCEDGKLRQISTDHVAGKSLFGKAPLTQYLGVTDENMALDPSVRKLEYKPGSRYLLCSDGMTDMLTDGEIADILSRESPAEETVQLLLERTLKKGGRDNVTIVLCEVVNREEKSFHTWIRDLKRNRGEGEGNEKQNG